MGRARWMMPSKATNCNPEILELIFRGFEILILDETDWDSEGFGVPIGAKGALLVMDVPTIGLEPGAGAVSGSGSGSGDGGRLAISYGGGLAPIGRGIDGGRSPFAIPEKRFWYSPKRKKP